MCSSGVSFDPVVDDTRYTFDVAGLYGGVFVMEDRQTGSVWTHFDGRVLVGPLAAAGIDLPIVPMIHTTWARWLETFPASVVLDWYPEYAGRYRPVTPGGGSLSERFRATVGNWDDRLPDSELVLGVDVGDASRAYVMDQLPAVVNDVIEGTPVVVFAADDASFAIAYAPVVAGEILEFSAAGGVISDGGGSVWDVTGTAIDGPRSGSQLEFITSFVTEWYGWAAYHPETSVWLG